MPRKKRQRPTRGNPSKIGSYVGPCGGSYPTIVKSNALMEKYYQAQNIVPAEEWDSFLEAVRNDLPITFRFTGCKSEATAIKRIFVERYASKLDDLIVEGEKIKPPQELTWYPDGLGFQINLPRKIIRKDSLLTHLHNFLITETEQGYLSRQEAVSMIPPLLLDVNSKSRVLDMCAAPGSKTAQLIEMLHDDSTSIPEGVVIANDTDCKRCYLLIHQSLKRLPSPCCVVVNHDASSMPCIFIPDEKDDSGLIPILYDRILCDVPCSGDGTLRKNVDVWKKWNSQHAHNLHNIQCRILKRGLELLQSGGRLVYSTCSLNPIEDEAVVANALHQFAGAVELLDVSTELPRLRRTAGLSTWKVSTKDGTLYDSFDQIPIKHRSSSPATLFPPTKAQAETMHLNRCFRILPHHQDTGGFFVAVLHKIGPLSSSYTEAEASNGHVKDEDEETSSQDPLPEKKSKNMPLRKKRKTDLKEEPFTFLNSESIIWQGIKGRFAFSDDFPHGQLLARTAQESGLQKKTLFMVNKIVKDILQTSRNRLRVVSAGARVFGKTDEKQDFKARLAQEGLAFLLPFITSRIVTLVREDILAILKPECNTLITQLSSSCREQLAKFGEGSLVGRTVEPPISICMWMGQHTVVPYISKEARMHFLRLLDIDTTEYELKMLAHRRNGKATDHKAEMEETEPTF